MSDRSSRKIGRTCAKSANGKRRQPEENQTPVRTKARLTIEELGEKKRGVSQGKLRGTSSRSLSPTFRLPGNYQLFLCITFVSLLSFLPTPLSCVFLRLIHTINLGSLLSFSHSFPLSSPPLFNSQKSWLPPPMPLLPRSRKPGRPSPTRRLSRLISLRLKRSMLLSRRNWYVRSPSIDNVHCSIALLFVPCSAQCTSFFLFTHLYPSFCGKMTLKISTIPSSALTICVYN